METNIIINEDFAAVHAYLCGDGYVSGNNLWAKHKYYRIGLRNTNSILLRDFQLRFENVFGKKPTISKHADRCDVWDKKIFFWLKNTFGSFHSSSWKIPEVLISKQSLSFWLRAFFDCEGWVESVKGKNRQVGLESINKTELARIQMFLKDFFQIKSTIRTKKRRTTSKLSICSKADLIKFRDNIGFNHPSKKAKLDEAINSFMNYYWKFPQTDVALAEFVLNLIRKRARLLKQKRIRICSNKRCNLVILASALVKLFAIESKVSNARFNGIGTKYFELSIRKPDSISKLAGILT